MNSTGTSNEKEKCEVESASRVPRVKTLAMNNNGGKWCQSGEEVKLHVYLEGTKGVEQDPS